MDDRDGRQRGGRFVGRLVSGTQTRYWPYGATRSGSIDPNTQTAKLNTGQQIENGDSALGLYKARFYSTTLGRFVSADPITKDGLNRYTYVGNNPSGRVDPNGHCFTFLGNKLDCASDGSDAVAILRCALTCGDNWYGQIMRWGLHQLEFWDNVASRARGTNLALLNAQLLEVFVEEAQNQPDRWNVMPWIGFWYFGLAMHTTERYSEARAICLLSVIHRTSMH